MTDIPNVIHLETQYIIKEKNMEKTPTNFATVTKIVRI